MRDGKGSCDSFLLALWSAHENVLSPPSSTPALFTKTWRINKIMHNAQQFRRVKVTIKDTVMPMIALLICDIAILTAMTGAYDILCYSSTAAAVKKTHANF